MSSTLIRPGGRLRRTFAGVLASALVAAPLALIPGSAQAAPTGAADGGTATWGLSTYLGSSTFGRATPLASAYVAPASFDSTSRLATWGNATGTVNDDGSASLAFEGTSVNFSATGGAWLKLADLQATLDASGNGTLSASVSYGTAPGTFPNIAFDPAQAPQNGPKRVTLMNLAGNTADDHAVTATQASWTGLDGTWSDDFTTFLAGDAEATPPVPGFIYAGQINNTATDRTALPISFDVDRTTAKITSAAVVGQTPTSLQVAVSGTGYKVGGVGIYTSLGETGNDDVLNPGEYLGTVWSANPGNPDSAVKADGSFSTTLNLDAAAIAQLDPTKSYSVITFKAHGQAASDASQTASSTPITIDFAAFAKYTSAPAITTANKVYGKSAAVVVTVPTVNGVVATGNVVLAGAGTQTKALSGGKATFTLPANLSPGKRNLTASFQGDGNYVAAASAARPLTVTKDAVTITDKVTKKPTTKKAGKIRITVKAKSSSIKPTGKVKVYFKKKGQKTVVTSTSSLKNGVKTLSVKKLKKKGTWKIYVKYTAGTGYNSVSSKYVGTVKVTK